MQKLHVRAAKLLALGIIVLMYGFTRLPQLSEQERRELASEFSFTRLELPSVTEKAHRSIRRVHPKLQRISAWISSVGASVALNDIDADGLSNDLCYVDVRTDDVIVTPVPGTGERYAPFALLPHSIYHDPSTVAPMGCLPGDLNEDGFTDVLVYYWGRPPVAFLRRPEPGAPAPSVFVSQAVGNPEDRWFTNAAALADVDGDGHPDLIIGNYFQDGARILDPDATGDSPMQHSMSRAFNGGTNRILLWASAAETSVSYREAAGIFDEETARGWTLALGAADLDGDQLAELYVANDFGPDRLFHNRSQPGNVRLIALEGEKTLTTPRSKVLGRDSFKGMGTDFGDLNGDGLLDIYVSNIAAEYALEESHFAYVSTGAVDRMHEGVAPYIDRSEQLGLSRSDWGWESRLADFNNDGVLEAVQATGFVRGTANRWPELQELATGNDELLMHSDMWPRIQAGDALSGSVRNPFFARSRSGRYFDISRELGLDHPQVSRGIATADVDGDGDLDFAVANQWEPSFFFRNDSPEPGKSLILDLRVSLDNGASRPAIGAQVVVVLSDGRRLVGQADGGSGHSGKRSPDVHIGLGDLRDGTVVPVSIRWRDSSGTVHEAETQLEAGRHRILLDSLLVAGRNGVQSPSI